MRFSVTPGLLAGLARFRLLAIFAGLGFLAGMTAPLGSRATLLGLAILAVALDTVLDQHKARLVSVTRHFDKAA